MALHTQSTTALVAAFCWLGVATALFAVAPPTKHGKSKALPLPPAVRGLQGVWEDRPSAEFADPCRRNFLFFQGTNFCHSALIVGNEAFCREGYFPFTLRRGAISSEALDARFEQLTFTRGKLAFTQSGEKGGPVTTPYVRTRLRSVPDQQTIQEAERRWSRYRAEAERILAAVERERPALERQAARAGLAFSPALLERTVWYGIEGSYVDILQYSDRARRALGEENEQGAILHAVNAQEALCRTKESVEWELRNPRPAPASASEPAPSPSSEEERAAARRQALQDPVFTYLSVDIPDHLKAIAGAGYESSDVLGGIRLTPVTPICPHCEGVIILSVVTTGETDADLAKYPIALNGEDRGMEQINGVAWRHFTLEGKSGPYEVYAVIRDGRRYSMELFSQGLWSEQDRAGITGYNAAAARAFADDFSHIARSARMLR